MRWFCVSRKGGTVGQWEVGGVPCRMMYTWWLLGLSVKGAWLGLGGPIFTLTA